MDLDRLIDDFRGPLVGLLRSWGAGAAEAEELAQDSFAEAFLSAGSFRGDPTNPAAAGGWLRGIARNLWLSTRRRRNRRVIPLGEVAVEPAASTEAPAGAASAELMSALGTLPRKQREVLWMRYLEDSPVREVAAVLGETEKAVESRLYQARKALKAAVTRRSESGALEARR